MRILAAALLAGALTLATACGGSSPSAPAATTVQTAPPAKPAGSKFTIDVTPGVPPVQVEVLQAGTGNKIAGVGGTVVIDYTGTAQGQEPYASTRQQGSQPWEVIVGYGKMGLIPGVDTALTHMRAGDRWKLTIPPELAYGPNGGPKVPPNSIVEFDVEVLEVK